MAATKGVLVALVQRGAHAAATPAEELHEQRLLHVEPVLRLLPDQAAGSVHDGRCDLLAAVRRKAMHREGIGTRRVEQRVVHPVGRECIAAFLGLGLLAHRRPGVGIDD